MMAQIDHEIRVTGPDREACSVVMHARREFINRPVKLKFYLLQVMD